MEPLDSRTKILPREELARRSRFLRDSGNRLVLTNGCFDLLHRGHVRSMEQARSLGDALAVGINSDRSVRRLKGPYRPVTDQQARAEIIAALGAVDFVVIFDEDTAAELVAELEPAIYAKGGDYSNDPTDPRFPVEGHAVLAYGGEVAILQYLHGTSTTSLLQDIGHSHNAQSQ